MRGAQLAHSGKGYVPLLGSSSRQFLPIPSAMASWSDRGFRLRATPPALRASLRRSLGLGYLLARPSRASRQRALRGRDKKA